MQEFRQSSKCSRNIRFNSDKKGNYEMSDDEEFDDEEFEEEDD